MWPYSSGEREGERAEERAHSSRSYDAATLVHTKDTDREMANNSLTHKSERKREREREREQRAERTEPVNPFNLPIQNQLMITRPIMPNQRS